MRLKLPVLRSPSKPLVPRSLGEVGWRSGGVGGPVPNRTRHLLVRGPILLTIIAFLLLSFSSVSSVGAQAQGSYFRSGAEETRFASGARGSYSERSEEQGSRPADSVGRGSYYDRLLELQRLIKEYQAKITGLQGQERTLKNEITYLDTQIYLTQLEIEEAETEIKLLSEDIGDLSQRLERIASFLEFQEKTFVARARSAYISDQLSSFDIILGSENLDEAMRQIKYLKVLEAQDREVLEQIRDIRADYNAQKALLEEKKADVEELKKTVEDKKVALEGQRGNRAYLLAVTRNDEQRYQGLLAQVKAEVDSINRALRGGGSPIGWKKAGDRIAWEGNTGCSTGCHLHFEYRVGGSAPWQSTPVNPLPYLNNGTLKWPEINPTIAQWYGDNKWIYKYYGYPQGHPGIDMYLDCGAPIFAAKRGYATLHRDYMYCYHLGRWTTGWGVIIDHQDGTYTIYWHIQGQ